MDVYAVKYPKSDQWRVARKVKAAEYGKALGQWVPLDWDVWSEVGTTALIGTVGNGEKVVMLERAAGDREGG